MHMQACKCVQCKDEGTGSRSAIYGSYKVTMLRARAVISQE
jgi:hypothetical protein